MADTDKPSSARVVRDFMLFTTGTLLIFNGYLAYLHSENYFSSLPKLLFTTAYLCLLPLLTLDENWLRVIPALAAMIGTIFFISKGASSPWRGFFYWLVLVGWFLFCIFGAGIEGPLA